MKTLEFTQQAGADGLVRLNIPVDSADTPYHVVVHIEPARPNERVGHLPEEFIQETAGKWVGDFIIEPEGEYEERESL